MSVGDPVFSSVQLTLSGDAATALKGNRSDGYCLYEVPLLGLLLSRMTLLGQCIGATGQASPPKARL